MRENLIKLFHHQSLQLPIKLSFLVNLLSLFILLLKWGSLPPQVPLFYSHPWGETQLASFSELLILPISSLFVFGVNSILASFFLDEEPLITKMLIWIAFLNSLLSTITLVKIVFLVS